PDVFFPHPGALFEEYGCKDLGEVLKRGEPIFLSLPPLGLEAGKAVATPAAAATEEYGEAPPEDDGPPADLYEAVGDTVEAGPVGVEVTEFELAAAALVGELSRQELPRDEIRTLLLQ